MDNSPFFIVGSGRSGTTLLRLILCGHSRLYIPPETWFIADLVARFPLHTPLSPEQVRDAVEVMSSHYRWSDLDIPAEELQAQAAALPSPRLVDLINLSYGRHLKRMNKPRFGDKTPNYIAVVPQLLALYPDARFINLIRDGRDVAISFVDAHFRSRPYHADFEWTQAIRLSEQWHASSIADRILDVRYEDLVRDPESTIERICSFLGERSEPAMFAYRERIGLVPERENRIHAKLSRPIDPAAIAVWRQKLTALECFLIEASIHKELVRLGYPPRFGAPAWRPLLAITATALRVLGPLLDWVVPALERRGVFRRNLYV